MLRATHFSGRHLLEDDVKLLLIDACIECECDRITIVYAVEDVDKYISSMKQGTVALWVLTYDYTNIFFGRVLDDEHTRDISSINKYYGIKKMYRIERMSTDYNVVELEFNE
jgi:hypothetical protein